MSADLWDDAAAFLRDLTDVHHDASEVDRVCREWLAETGSNTFGPLCAAALRTVFAECLTETPTETLPPGSVTFIHPRSST